MYVQNVCISESVYLENLEVVKSANLCESTFGGVLSTSIAVLPVPTGKILSVLHVTAQSTQGGISLNSSSFRIV